MIESLLYALMAFAAVYFGVRVFHLTGAPHG